jgi:hypothetical protein
MATIPLWLLGRHLTAVTLIPQTVNATTGVLSAGTTQTLTVVTKSITIRREPQSEDIRPVNSSVVNNVNHSDDSTLDLTILLRQGVGAIARNQIEDAIAASDYFQANFTSGAKAWSGYFTRGTSTDGVTNYGANEASITLRQIDVGSANPTYT